jgi:hypothetical protein
MSFIDKAKAAAENLADKAKELMSENLDRFEGSIDAAGESAGKKLIVQFDGGQWPVSGVLSEMGYRVGSSGLAEDERRRVLRDVFEVQLISSSPETNDYIQEWGPPQSSQRLAKMNRALSGFLDLARRRNSADMSGAIADWEADLAWLAKHFG